MQTERAISAEALLVQKQKNYEELNALSRMQSMRCTELQDQLQKKNLEWADYAYEWAEDFAKMRDRKDAYKYKTQKYGEVIERQADQIKRQADQIERQEVQIKRQKVQTRNLQILIRDRLDDEDENSRTVIISDDDSTGMQVLWERN